ncbi:2-amino-4-hydroxy-6-hydroxymethyldihydropteridinepyrophosphokinase [hydrothermal vent metagenome]|uniref:2-amino-4-hydroxy-6-hydroxymethyldihydropteridine diphosphokinase n=1 Tax=hydrothermal vent metagenome TaxID=652676 RepID=A0A3B1BB96_9ZZZZ
MITAYIGLGANLDDPRAQLVQAIDELATLPNSQLLATSSFYRSSPMVLPGQSPETQPDYINAVASLETSLTPHALLDELQIIEQAHGRQRNGRRWGPRTLDLDILLYGNQQLNDKRLQVPHAGMAVRNFVLYPLQELVSEQLALPGMGRLADLLERCSLDGLEKITL